MTDLIERRCVACRKGAPRVTEEQIKELSPQIPAWDMIQVDGIDRLTRTYSFKDFAEALEFTNAVGQIAEREGHHPAILTEWGKVTIAWWTHKIKGLHENDFIMSAKTDALM